MRIHIALLKQARLASLMLKLILVVLEALALAGAARATDLAVYKGAGCIGAERIQHFENWLGRRVDRVVDFLDGRSWAALEGSAQWIARCWSDAGYPLALSIPMLPTDGSATLSDGQTGALDQHFETVAQILVANGHADAILRIGWEFNGSWYPWAASRDPKAFIAFWRRIVFAMRRVPGAQFRFDWNPTIGAPQIKPDRVYPGGDVVDIIGLDVYNQSWAPNRHDVEARWKEKLNGAYGLEWHRKFARAKGKPVSFPEWGTGNRSDGHGAGDDPVFIARMHNWIVSSDAIYHGYWDYRAEDIDGEISSGRYPAAGAEFRRVFRSARD
jgi:hypothetical protein